MRVDTHTDAMPLGGYNANTHLTNEQINARLNGLTISNDIEPITEVSNELTQDVVYTITETPVEPSKELSKDVSTFPLEIFPSELQNYLISLNNASGHNVDFMAGALLWVTSVVLGNTRQIQACTTWKEFSTIWLFAVGVKGFGKSAPLKAITSPLSRISTYNSMAYADNQETIIGEAKAKLSEELKTEALRNEKRVLTNTTMEGLAKVMNSGKLGVGIFRDEIRSWVLDMGVYKGGGGSDKNNYLEAYDGATMDVNRSGAPNIIVPNATISVLGGIQPDIFEHIRTDDNESSGFTDRILYLFPEKKRPKRSSNEMSQELLDWYDTTIQNFYDSTMSLVERDEAGVVIPKISHFTTEAKREWVAISESFEDRIDSDDVPNHVKGYIAKSKGRVLRFALIINTLNSMAGGSESIDTISIDSLSKAKKLSDYFEAMNIKTIEEARNRDTGTWKASLSKTAKENYLSLVKRNPKITIKAAADKIGKSVRAIAGYKSELKKEGKI